MSKGLRSWVQANWVDIANPKKGGGFPKCGRSGGEKRKTILNVYLLQKLDQCLQVKELLLYQEKRKLKEKQEQVRNLTTQELK
jgi:hypothetical protein